MVVGLVSVLAANIRALRSQKGMTQQQLANRCGLSVSYISMLEHGQRQPTLDTLELLSSVLGLPPLLLLEQAMGA